MTIGSWPTPHRGSNAGSSTTFPSLAPPTASSACSPSFRAGLDTQASAAGNGLIVLASFSELTAIGPHGREWGSERLCLDNLKIVTASAGTIECIGDFIECAEHFTIDARTGVHQDGRRFLHLPHSPGGST